MRGPSMIRAEFVKLRRSAVWAVAAVLPVVAVATGSLNFMTNRGSFTGGWSSFTSQVTLFYSLLFFAFGVGLLASTAWRMEHRGNNWNLLLTGPAGPLRIAVGKIVAILAPVAVMQAVLLAGTVVAGRLVARLPGLPPAGFVAVTALSVVTAIPLVALQSMLSMLMRSFAAPVGVCLAGCVAGFAAITSPTLRPLSWLVPQSLVTRGMAIGSSAFDPSVGGSGVFAALPIVADALVLGAALTALTAVLLRRTHLR